MSFSTMCPFGWTLLTHLPCGFHPLPDAEVAHDPGDEQAQSQVPVQRAHVVEAWGNPQRSPPAETGDKTRVFTVVFRTARYHRKEVRRPAELTPRTRGQERWRSGPLWPTSSSLKTPHSFLGRWGEEGQNVKTLKQIKKHLRSFWCVLNSIPYLCSTCCCRTTRPGPRRRRTTGRKSPRPERWCSRSSTESRSPGCHSQDLQKEPINIQRRKHISKTRWTGLVTFAKCCMISPPAYLQTRDWFSSSRWCLPRWCTGPGPSQGRRQERHRWRGRSGRGWGKHLSWERGKRKGFQGSSFREWKMPANLQLLK